MRQSESFKEQNCWQWWTKLPDRH